MSDADALQATERMRELVANPRAVGLEPRAGLEPLDVSCKFNRAASHTKSAYQCIIRMRITLDDGATWRTEAALVAEGRTKAEALEMFFNWMADESAVARFTEVVKAHDAAKVDALAQAALEEKRAEEKRVVGVAKDNNQSWAERKLDQLAREVGFVKPKVQV